MMVVHRSSQHSTPPHHYEALSPSRGRKVQRDNSLFPLEGKCRAAAKGCTRPRVEMIRKGCPDRQTAACFWGMPLAVFAIVHPRATMWPSPPQGGTRGSGALCSHRLQWSRGQRHNSLFPLEGKCRVAAKGCTRLRVEKKHKGSPDRQTAACLGECHLRLLRYSTPAPLRGPLPLKGAQGSAVLCAFAISNGAGGSGTISCFPLRGNAAQRQKGV